MIVWTQCHTWCSTGLPWLTDSTLDVILSYYASGNVVLSVLWPSGSTAWRIALTRSSSAFMGLPTLPACVLVLLVVWWPTSIDGVFENSAVQYCVASLSLCVHTPQNLSKLIEERRKLQKQHEDCQRQHRGVRLCLWEEGGEGMCEQCGHSHSSWSLCVLWVSVVTTMHHSP